MSKVEYIALLPAIVVLISLIVWLLSLPLKLINTVIQKRKLDKKLCQHGIPGGQTRLKCETCKLNAASSLKRQEAKKIHLENLKKIKEEANLFRKQELLRLARRRLQKLTVLINQQPNAFESLVAKMYEEFGFLAEQTPMTNDFGRDIILQKDGKKIFVECKCYAATNLVSRPAIQKFYGAMIGEQANEGFFVTTSDFTAGAKQFAERTKIIKLINGSKLAALMTKAFPETSNENEYRAMCLQCREIISFNIYNETLESTCQNGHVIQNDFSIKDLDQIISEFAFSREGQMR